MQENTSLRRATRKPAILIALLLIILGVTYFIWNYSFLNVQVSSANPSGGKYIYKLQGQDGSVTEIKTSSSMKKLLPKGEYSILVTQNEKGGFTTVKTSGLLKNFIASVTLAPEKSRKFVGNNPLGCTYYLEILYSYECGASFQEINTHVPATSSSPTYTTRHSGADIHGLVEGIIRTSNGSSIALIHFSEPGGPSPRHVAYQLTSGLQVTADATLSDLDGSQNYLIKPFREGFIIYDESFSQILYYATINSRPENVTPEKPTDTDLRPTSISLKGSSLLAVYSSITEEEVSDTKEPAKEQSELIWQDGGQTKHFKFRGQQSNFTLCGSSKLCLLDNEKLKVYDMTGKKPKLLFTVSGVNFVENVGESLLAVRKNEILALDVDKRSGFIDYNFGNYKYCGVQSDINRYLLCLINNKNDKVALLIDQVANNLDSIDKKISALQKLPEVDKVSIYDNYIYISPNLGSLVFNEALEGYTYDPETKRVVKDIINQEINKLGIDRKKYTIVNTSD